jgi:hypothetical protein
LGPTLDKFENLHILAFSMHIAAAVLVLLSIIPVALISVRDIMRWEGAAR